MAKWIYKKHELITEDRSGIKKHLDVQFEETYVNNTGTYYSIIRNNQRLKLQGMNLAAGDYIPLMESSIHIAGGSMKPPTASGEDIVHGMYFSKMTGRPSAGITSFVRVESALYKYSVEYIYSKGSYIGEVTAEEGTYPIDGRHSDGYWYVKDRLANTAPQISGSDMDLGSKTHDFDVDYVITDTTENDSVKVEVYVNDILKETKASVSLGYKYAYKVKIGEYGLGNHAVKIVATDSHGVTDTRVYRFTKSNTAPQITSAMGEVLGEKNTAFTYVYQVSDENKDSINITVSLNGKEINNLTDVPQNEDLTITITDEMINVLELGVVNTISIRADDGKGGITYKRIAFVRTNRPPIISDSDKDLGIKLKAFPLRISATDIEKDEISLKVYIDDILLKDFGVVEDNKQYTINVDHDTFIKLSPGKHTIKIIATDSKDASSERLITFTRAVGKLDVIFEIKDTDVQPEKILFSPEFVSQYNYDNSLIKVTNNFKDKVPVWEDVTKKSLAGQAHVFENQVKTADRWFVAAQVIYDDKEVIAYLRSMTGGYE